MDEAALRACTWNNSLAAIPRLQALLVS